MALNISFIEVILSDSFWAGLFMIEFPPPHGGEQKSKGLETGEEIKEGKKRKKENLGKKSLLTVPNHKN